MRVDGFLLHPAQAPLSSELFFLGVSNPPCLSGPDFCFLNPTRAVPRLCAAGAVTSSGIESRGEENLRPGLVRRRKVWGAWITRAMDQVLNGLLRGLVGQLRGGGQ